MECNAKDLLLYLKGNQTTVDGDLVYTKRRQYQTQAGENKALFHTWTGSNTIERSALKEIVGVRENLLISVLDASQDDIGARANFGRGNDPRHTVSAYDHQQH